MYNGMAGRLFDFQFLLSGKESAVQRAGRNGGGMCAAAAYSDFPGNNASDTVQIRLGKGQNCYGIYLLRLYPDWLSAAKNRGTVRRTDRTDYAMVRSSAETGLVDTDRYFRNRGSNDSGDLLSGQYYCDETKRILKTILMRW